MAQLLEGVEEGELDRLYGAAPEDFVAEREALARRLKQDGNADAAAAVRSLAKPTLPVWLVNRLARERKPKVRELVKAGERLREAHAGGDLSAFREATKREREAVADLLDEARKLVRGEDRRVSEAMLDRVASTLHAAAADEEARFRLAQGRLAEELEPPGFELLAGIAPAAPKRGAKQKQRGDDRAERRRELAAARKELAAAQARARELRRAAGEAERALEAAREEAEDAEAAVEEAKQRVESLQ
jgi:hypothetical protein